MAIDPKAAAEKKKKTITIIAVVVVLGFVLWQVMQLMGGGSSSAPPAAVPKAMPPQASNAATPPPSPGAPPASAAAAAAMPNGAVPAAPSVTQANVMIVPNESDAIEKQKTDQKEYLQEVNKLQLLKIRREIEETNQAISAAKLASATTNKSMTDLLTKAAPQPVPEGEYSNSLISPVQTGGGVNISGMPAPIPQQGAVPPPPIAAAPAEIPTSPYVVISVAMQFHRWSAVIGTTMGAQGSLYSVKVGDSLPDGSVVQSINRDGVMLEKDKHPRKISIVSSI